MARYALNSAVVTSPGSYEYRLLSRRDARFWWRIGPVVSTIGYEETAEALSELLSGMAGDIDVPVDRRTITMDPGDEALVFRLAFPPGTRRIDPRDKGALGRALIAGHYELGLLRRTS